MKAFIFIVLLAFFSLSQTPKGADIPAYDANLSAYPYPYPVKFFDFKSQKQDVRMAYMDESPKVGNGQTVVLMHGKNFSGYYWQPTMKVLLEKGFRVVVPDQIGFGKSTKPESYQFSFHSLADNTNMLLESLGIKQVEVVGHSMGGMLAVRFALMYPAKILKLILINPLGLEDWKTLVPYRGIDDTYTQELKATPSSIREYQKNFYYNGKWKPEYEDLIQPLIGFAKHPDYLRVAWTSSLVSEMIYTQPVVYEFPLIKSPTLLIIGQRDRTAPGADRVSKDVADKLGNYAKLGKMAKKAIPKAKLVEIPKVGHMPQVEKFDEYKKALLEFLSN